MKKILFCLVMLCGTRLLAVTPVPFREGVGFSTRLSGNTNATLTVYAETTEVLSNTASGPLNESDISAVWLKPGKRYTMTMAGSGTGAYEMSFTAPDGYELYIDDEPSDLEDDTISGAFSDDYTLELRPVTAQSGGAWGSFSGVSLGKSITWEIGLGSLRTGTSAGSIVFKELSLTTSPASRARLYYDPPPTALGQINVVRDGASNQTLRQIVVPLGFQDFVDLPAGGYEIRFYYWSQVTGWTGALYTFSGTPWKTLKVESPAAHELKITETEGTAIKVSHLKETGSVTPGAIGGTITTEGAYTIHTFSDSGTFSYEEGISSVQALVVAGGGGGGGGYGGGGGGGGVVSNLSLSLTPGSYSVIVGSGGSKGLKGSAQGGNGGNSSFNGMTAVGGGGGASGYYNPYALSGGSGGGATDWGSGGSGTSGQGNAGGAAQSAGPSAYGCGGGGGANGAGQAGGVTAGGNGGIGVLSSITGLRYGGGGGGGTWNGEGITGTPGSGGNGGGGDAGNVSGNGKRGTNGRGGGGGGGSMADDNTDVNDCQGGLGGSGVVVIKYLTPTGTAGNFSWTLEEGDGTTVLRTTTHTSTVPAAGQRDVVAAVKTGGAAGPIIAETKFHYENQPWGEELRSITAGPDLASPAARTTEYEYHTDNTAHGNYRKVKTTKDGAGNWAAYEYHDSYERRGQLLREYHPWLDTTPTPGFTTAGRVIEYTYTYDWTGRYRELYSRIEKINGVMTAQTIRDQNYDTAPYFPRIRYNENTYSDTTNRLVTNVQYIRADAIDVDFIGKPCVQAGPDARQTSWCYSRGFYNPSTKGFSMNGNQPHWRELKFNGTNTSDGGAQQVLGYDSQACDPIWMIPNKSTMGLIIRIETGLVYRTATYVYTGSGNFSLLSETNFTYDGQGRLTQSLSSDGARVTYSYLNGRLDTSVDATGLTTKYDYDALGRVKWQRTDAATASGYALPGDLYTHYEYDGANHVTKSVVTASATMPTSPGAMDIVATATFDKAGRPLMTVANSGSATPLTTTYDYTLGAKITKVTLPGGGERISEVFSDGQLKSETGSAVVAKHYTPVAPTSAGAFMTQKINTGAATSSAEVITTTDWLGRSVTAQAPGGNGSPATSTWTYGASGHLTKLASPGLADTLYTYNTLGETVHSGLDLNANGSLDLALTDRGTRQDWTFFQDGSGHWWHRSTTSIYATNNSDTATEASKTEKQISGLPANRLSYTKSYDIFGNVTTTATDVDRTNKKVTTTIDVSASTTDAMQIAYNGLTVSSRDAAGLTTTFAYDALARLTSANDPRKGADKTVYLPGTSFVQKYYDAYATAQLPGTDAPTGTYEYDAAGRVKTATDARGKAARYEYTTRGEKYREWGDTVTPVEYSYDTWGRMYLMKTYRGGTGWAGSTWPTAPGTADLTKWVYDEATGLLKEKYDAANLDASGAPITSAKKVSYTYTQAGQLKTRTWSRGIVTTYHYFGEQSGEPKNGDLRLVDYSDSTPDIENTYTRLGHLSTAQLSNGLLTTLDHCTCGKLLAEILDSTYFGGRRIDYQLHSVADGAKGRTTGYTLKAGTTTEQSIAYGYDTFGRLNQVDADSQTFTYGYTTNSHLIGTLTNTALGYTDTRTYQPKRDLFATRETKISTALKAGFSFTHDAIGRVEQVTKTGEMFGGYGDGNNGLRTDYGYTDRSEVKDELTNTWSASGTPGWVPLIGRDDQPGYNYDNAGNRASTAGTTHNGTTASYTTNALNQYTERTVPGSFDVAGKAVSTTVTLSGGGSTRTAAKQGQAFFDAYPLANGSNPVFANLSLSTPQDTPTSNSVAAFLAKTPEVFDYDADGNLLRDGRWVYGYDAENRLISMVTRGAPEDPLASDPINAAVWNLSGFTRQKLAFTYDYLGRRISKQSSVHTGSAWGTAVETRFVYDGWNLIAEYQVSGSLLSLLRSYAWGLDVSGSRQGAGGVGGLLVVAEIAGGTITNRFLPAYDGNGNVHAMITASAVTFGSATYAAGDLVAAYEYDAFGRPLREAGPYAGKNPFRFSTKFTDNETGLVYYGRRFYSPSLGRFINRDPIGEQGGLNMYAFVSNNGVNEVDELGMKKIKKPRRSRKTKNSPPPQNPFAINKGPGQDVAPGILVLEKFVVQGIRIPDVNMNWGAVLMNLVLPRLTIDLSGLSDLSNSAHVDLNDIDCQGLRQKYSAYFAQPREAISDPTVAMVAATLAATAQTIAHDSEYQSVWYQTGPNTYGYSVPVPSASPIGGPGSNAIPQGATPLGLAHSHDVSYSAYSDWAKSNGQTPVSASTYAEWQNTFSIGDASIVSSKGLAVSVHTPSNSIRILTQADIRSLRPGERPAGSAVNGLPSPEEINMILSCFNRGN